MSRGPLERQGAPQWRAFVIGVGVALSLLTAPAAEAAITLAVSEAPQGPRIAVADDGTGHVAWGVKQSGDDTLTYCRLPRGASTCAHTVDLGGVTGTEQYEGGHVALDGANVYVFQYRCCSTQGTYLWHSTDGGQTFSLPRRIGYNNTNEIKLGPGSLASSVNDETTDGIFYQAMPIDGSPAPGDDARVFVGRGSADDYDGTTGFLDATTPIVAFSDHETIGYRVFDPSKGTSHNSIANWGPAQTMGPGDEARLASGPSGTWLFHGLPGSAKRFRVRGFDRPSGTFGAPFDLTGAAGLPIAGDFTQDKSGGLTAVWFDNADAGAIRFRTSPNGQTWSPTATAETPVSGASHLDVSTAPDGGGWVVWDANNAGPIKASPLTPQGAGSGTAPGASNKPIPSKALGPGGLLTVPTNLRCVSQRYFPIRLRKKFWPSIAAVTVKMPRRTRVLKRKPWGTNVDLRGLPKGTFKVQITVLTTTGKTIKGTRKYRTCRGRLRGGIPRL